jgi:hypothetical protein
MKIHGSKISTNSLTNENQVIPANIAQGETRNEQPDSLIEFEAF